MEPRNRMSGSCAVISIQISFLALHRYKTKNYSRGSIYNTSHQKILGQSVISPYGHQVAIITYRIQERGLEEGKYFQVLKWLGLKVAN